MKRIAWLVPSGVASQDSPMYIPILSRLACEVGEKTELTVFSFSSERVVRSSRIGKVLVHYLGSSWNDPLWKRAIALSILLLKEHRRRPFDALHGFWALPCGVLAVALGRFLGIRAVCSFLGGETASFSHLRYGNMRSWIPRYATLWTSRRATVLHLLTEFQRSGLAVYQPNFPNRAVVPFGVDITMFHPNGTRRSRTVKILHVANLTEIKDQESLLLCYSQIAKILPSRLRIVGPDYLDGYLQRLTTKLGLEDKVEFCGFVPHSDIAKHYQWAHLYLHTSLHEGQGVSAVEAMAAGVVVCGTRVGILSDLPDSCCLATPPGSPGLLAEAVLGLLRDKKRFDRIRRNALRWARSHDVRFSADKLVSMYKGLA